MDAQQVADDLRVAVDVYRARADRAMARLAALSSSDTSEGTSLLRYILRRDADRSTRSAEEALRDADQLSRHAEQEQLGAQFQLTTDMVTASESAIARVLKRVRVNADEKDDESEEEGHGDRKRRKVSEKQGCAVCLEEFQEGLEVASMPCSHLFHNNCITTWLQRKLSCPLCRREVVVLD